MAGRRIFHYWGEMITYLGMTMPMAIWSTITWIKMEYHRGKVAFYFRLEKEAEQYEVPNRNLEIAKLLGDA
ncbi:hypothetical protein [Fusicatenibacter sp.]